MRLWFLILLTVEALVGAEIKISHAPRQPRSNDSVKVTVVPGTNVFRQVTVEVQAVEPGNYIRKIDPAYRTEWRDFLMGETNGVFTAFVPPELQKHRSLVRYRVKTVSAANETNYFPALTNIVSNFAWFVYDGPSAWTGASKPGHTPPLTFPSDFFGTLPSYFLLARADDVRRSQWDQSYYRRPLFGTFVYDGEVYDHILFHNRGQGSTYVSGKNKWGFKFNSGHDFAARNPWGEPYQIKWNGINLNPCASAWAQVNRGMSGMDEALAYRAYQLAGVPSPDTFWVQFRVVDSREEAPSQYEGDLWGLYLVVQEKNGAWLRENHLPDGNIYSAESGPKHLVAGSSPNSEDLIKFSNEMHRKRDESWWRAHFDLPDYYSFHALNRLLANIDLRPDGNYYLYHRPDDRWVVLPHDLDMMFIPKTHQPGYVPQSRCLDIPALQIEYKNRAREILDLLASDPRPNGGQIGQLIAELAARIAPAGQQRTWAELDEAIWNWHPRSHAKGQFNVSPYTDHRMGGPWRRTLDTPNFAGFCKYLLEFCTESGRHDFDVNDGKQRGYGFGYLAAEANDPAIPARPTVRLRAWSGPSPAFSISGFSSPVSARFTAVQWRIAEISAPGLKGYIAGKPYRYEIESGCAAEFGSPSAEFVPKQELFAPEHTYRVRARYQDDSGRWSHWSEPIQFVPGEG